MNCPNCETEYRDGFTRCTDCDVDLVAAAAAAPEEPGHDIELVKIFEGGNAAVLPLIESLFRDAGIEFMKRNQATQDLFVLGGYSAVPTMAGAPVEFWVRVEDEEAARDLLAGAPGEEA
ncbi:MAG TPA: DUF2007 domain-containing protein [Thermoanaerobaculia bacterium]|nr:DUF2007 domain-containing protein [Thermoanaerobaculia bacterium]